MNRGFFQLVDGITQPSRQRGTLAIQPDGEALSLTWRFAGLTGSPSIFRGVGFVREMELYAARIPTDDHDGSKPGVVVYDISRLGRLPARWYHEDLQGMLGSGLSVDGPTDTLIGTYKAEYGSATQEFAPLRKSLTEHGRGYRFRWSDPERDIYTGIGFAKRNILVCAWGEPSAKLEVVHYQMEQPGRLLGSVLGLINANRYLQETFELVAGGG